MTNSDHTRDGGGGRYDPHGYQQPPAPRRNQLPKPGATRPAQQTYYPQHGEAGHDPNYGYPDQGYPPHQGGQGGYGQPTGHGEYDPSLDQRPRPPVSGRDSRHHSQPPQQQDDYYYPQGQNVLPDMPSYAMPPEGHGGTQPHHTDTPQDWGGQPQYPSHYQGDQEYNQGYAQNVGGEPGYDPYGGQGYEPDTGMEISQRLAQLQSQYDQERAAATWQQEEQTARGYYPDYQQQGGGNYDEQAGYYQQSPALNNQGVGQARGYDGQYDHQPGHGGRDDYYADHIGSGDQSDQATPYYQEQYSQAGHDYVAHDAPERGGVLKRVMMGVSFVTALIIGGGVAYTYKYTDTFGASNSSGAMPVVKAGDTPVKIVKAPDGSSDESLNNSMHNHMAGDEKSDPIGERLAEENKDIGSKVAAAESGMLPSDGGTNLAPGAPRRVKTLIVRPDGTILQPAGSDDEVDQGSTDSASDTDTTKEVASADTNSSEQVSESPKDTQQTASIEPSQAAAEEPARRAVKMVAARPSTIGEIGVPYVVQVTSRSSQTSALAAFADMQQKYPSLIGTYEPDIQRADLGDKGIWYRLRVGPVASKTAANDLCDKLKAAGHPGCFVRKK